MLLIVRKKYPLFLALIVVVLGSSYLYFLKSPASETTTPVESVEKSENRTEEKTTEKSIYTPFSPEVLENSRTRRRVLFFYANWCPTCKPADESFAENVSQIPSDMTVIRVNYNDTETDQAEKELAKKYGVTYQHTFVQIDAQGNEVATWNGGQIDELLEHIQ
jgi:thioredoxin 1